MCSQVFSWSIPLLLVGLVACGSEPKPPVAPVPAEPATPATPSGAAAVVCPTSAELFAAIKADPSDDAQNLSKQIVGVTDIKCSASYAFGYTDPVPQLNAEGVVLKKEPTGWKVLNFGTFEVCGDLDIPLADLQLIGC